MATSDYDFLNSLNESQLKILLGEHVVSESPQRDERQSQRETMARKRAAERDLAIPIPKEPNRRRDCIADAELFCQTYFGDEFHEPFTSDRSDMLGSIIHAARYGGDQAIAGPRGEGKTAIAIKGAVYLMVSMISSFPVVVGKNQTKAGEELRDLREKLQQSDLLLADFPELCVPFRSIGAWSSRARMQTVMGEPTNVILSPHKLVFPTIDRWQLPANWPDDIEPASCGQVMFSLGIDGPIRGTRHRGKRPTLAIIDDIEDREAAESDPVIAKNEDILEKDIAGLGDGAERVARVMLCTTQNRKCIAYRYTDPKQKQSWKGKRYRKMITPPDRMDLVEQYIQMRVEREDEDPDARVAHQFWREHVPAIEAGSVVSNPQSYSKKIHSDGEPLEWSAVQAYYNRVADWGQESVATEIDNDPPEVVGPQGSGLTASLVMSRNSGLARNQVPANASTITAGIDLGKYECHWVIAAWWKGAGGCVIDYGVTEVHNTTPDTSDKASEQMIYNALLNWRDETMRTPIVDASGSERSIDAVFVDSGAYTDAAYEFVRQVGGAPFYATKGAGGYRPPKPNENIVVGNNLHASNLIAERLWLYNISADYWKRWVHERFLTPTFDEANMLRQGALSVYQPEGNKRHLSYSQHVVAEEWVSEFKQGKGEKCYWLVHNRNNHWLDATALAAAAASIHGINVMTNADTPTLSPGNAAEAKQKRQATRRRPQHGFKSRPGGWIQGARGRR